MTKTEFWFVFALAAIAAYCIVRYAAWRSYNKHQPDYRTADARKMDKQVRGLQAKVPTPIAPTAPAPATPAAITASLREARQMQEARVKREAVQAALFDIGKRDKTPNLYPLGCRAHVLWALHYDRVTADAAHAKQATRLHRVDKS